MSAISYIQGQPINFIIAPNGFVGMGTTMPMSKLHVEGDMLSTGTLVASNLVVTGDYVFFNTVTSNADPFIIQNSQQKPALYVAQVGVGTMHSVAEFWSTSGNMALKVGNDGRMGIGTSIPRATLDVAGDIVCTSITGNASNVTGLAPSAKTDTTNATNIISGTLAAARLPSRVLAVNVAGNLGVGTLAPTATMEVKGSSILATPPTIPPLPLVVANSGNSTTATVTGSGHPRYDGVYTIATSPVSSGIGNIFDMNDTSFWRTDTNYTPTYNTLSGGQSTIVNFVRYYGDWIHVTLPSATFLYSYTITRSSTIGTAPLSWDLVGTNDGGSTYVLIHSVRDVTGWLSSTSLTFVLQLQVAYSGFRIIISKTSGSTMANVAGLQFSGDTYLYTGARITGNLEIGPVPSQTRVVVNSTGIGIGTTMPQDALHLGVGGNIRLDELANPGSIPRSLVVNASGVVTIATSDSRLKQNIAPLRYGIDEVANLRPVEFEWRDTPGARDCGFIAQEVEAVIPEAVGTLGSSDIRTLDYTKLVPVLVKSIQDLRAELNTLQKRYNVLVKCLTSPGSW